MVEFTGEVVPLPATTPVGPNINVGTLPVNETVAGLVLELLMIFNDPVTVPPPAGVNVTVMMHDVPADKVAPHVFVWLNAVDPEMEMLDIVSVPAPELVRVVACVPEALNVRDVGLSVTAGVDAPPTVNDCVFVGEVEAPDTSVATIAMACDPLAKVCVLNVVL